MRRLIAVSVLSSALAVAMSILPQLAHADGGTSTRTETNDVALILADLEAMNQRIQSGDAALAHLSTAQKRDFEQHRQLVVELLSGKQLVGELPMESRIRAHNALEAIAAMVNQKTEDDQVVCRRERPVGTRMAHTVCRSVRGKNLEREAAQESLRRLPSTALPSGGGI